MANYIYLVPLFPLIGFLINGLLRKSLSKSLSGIIGSGTVLASFIVSLLIFFQVKEPDFQPQTVFLFHFLRVGHFNIPFSFLVDPLSSLFLLIITGVGFLIHLYSTAYMHDEDGPAFAKYFCYLNLFVFSMLLLVLGSNFVILFIGWEGVGLCSYLLIGYWFKNIEYASAAKKAFVMNRIGDVGFLIAIFALIARFDSASFDAVFGQASKASTGFLTMVTLLLLIGAMGKSAQIPLYTWLPDAMAGPTPVSALIHAATMVTAGIYMIARSHILYDLAPVSQTVVAIVGLTTAIFAATIAIKQNDIKKVLAYSTVSQLGYMFLGLGVGAYTGAVFHVMTHAFFKALLFLGAGSVIHAMGGEQDIRKMGALKKHLPITHITFLLACLAIAGIPPFSGFFSKDEILSAAYEKNPVYYVIGVAGAMMTAFYMFRLYATTFRGSFRGTADQQHHLHESPAAMTFPLVVLAILAVIGGFVGIPEVFAKDAHLLGKFLDPVLSTAKTSHEVMPASTEWMLMLVSAGLALLMVILAWTRFSRKPELNEASGFGKVLANKWYVDELYDAIVVKPLNAFADFLNRVVEKGVIDGIVNGVGRLVQYGSRQLRYLQSGLVGGYVLLMVVGIILLFVVQLFLRK
ncbi:MAG TPA: NADH-quinone oxidoreductase subunit L [Puia sp.]|nr:NADH-quinone oxidoreductase subunit L [Puia sp.]